MDSETLLIIGAVAIGGIAIYGLTKPIGQSLGDITGTIPWVEGQIEGFESWFSGVLH